MPNLTSESKKRRGHSPRNKFGVHNVNQPVRVFVMPAIRRERQPTDVASAENTVGKARYGTEPYGTLRNGMHGAVRYGTVWHGLILREPPRQNQQFSSRNVYWLLDTRKDAMKKLSLYVFRLQRTTERSRRGGKGHHISGDTAGSWFRNRRFR